METKGSKRGSNVGMWITVGLLGLALVASVAMNMGLFFALAMKGGDKPVAHMARGGEDDYPQLTERWSCGKGDVKVARIVLEGVIMRESRESFLGQQENKVDLLLHQIQRAKNDRDVKAIIVEVDSPGGGITPSDELYRALMDFRESEPGRKVVVFMRDLAASGGYYVSMAGDWLIAEPTTVVGSIGVIMQSLNWKELSEKIGIKDVTIKSGANKDLLNPFNDVPPEQRALLQTLIDSMYGHFLSIVQESRPIDPEKLKELADGRVFVAKDAVDLQLIDAIGYWNDAVEKTAELLGEKNVRVVRYEHRPTFFDIFSSIESPGLRLDHLTTTQAPQFMYLWKP